MGVGGRGGGREKDGGGGEGGRGGREGGRERWGGGGAENSSWTHSPPAALKIAGSWTVPLCCSRWTLCGSIGR